MKATNIKELEFGYRLHFTINDSSSQHEVSREISWKQLEVEWKIAGNFSCEKRWQRDFLFVYLHWKQNNKSERIANTLSTN